MSPGSGPEAEPADEARAPSEEAPGGAAGPVRRRGSSKKVALVRYGLLPRVGYFSTRRDDIKPGTACIARTERGTELGKLVTPPEPADGKETRGRIMRPASARDLDRMRYIETELAPRELTLCREKAEQAGLKMRLVAAEHLFGGEKIVFYFVAEKRVDFRELVRDLAREFRTRIELRQIGVRDEARMIAHFEHCGRPLCCKAFLRQFEPVMMRMAKLQKSTLDPGKISGRCGRLMCCLRFEEEVYQELREALPRKGTSVRAGDVVGRVADVEILAQKVVVRTEDGLTVSVPVAEIVVEKLPESPPPKKRKKRRRRETGGPEAGAPPAEPQAGAPPVEPQAGGPPAEPQVGGPPAEPQVGGPPLEPS